MSNGFSGARGSSGAASSTLVNIEHDDRLRWQIDGKPVSARLGAREACRPYRIRLVERIDRVDRASRENLTPHRARAQAHDLQVDSGGMVWIEIRKSDVHFSIRAARRSRVDAWNPVFPELVRGRRDFEGQVRRVPERLVHLEYVIGG